MVDELTTEQLRRLVLAKYRCGAGSLEFIQAVLQNNEGNDQYQEADSGGAVEAGNQPTWCTCGKC